MARQAAGEIAVPQHRREHRVEDVLSPLRSQAGKGPQHEEGVVEERQGADGRGVPAALVTEQAVEIQLDAGIRQPLFERAPDGTAEPGDEGGQVRRHGGAYNTAMEPNTLVLGLTWCVAFIFSTTLHEAGHALAALKLGDPTAYEGGQVSLNPWPHIRREPLGMVIVPIASFALNGWMMGWASAPFDPEWAHRYPKRAALMAAAGPAANLLLVLLSGLAI